MKAKFGFDPTDFDFFKNTGIFLVAYNDTECFMQLIELWDRSDDGYSNDWYDVDGDYIWGDDYTFEITVPEKKGDLYFNVESYYFNQVHKACFWLESQGMTSKYFNIYKNSIKLYSYELIYDSIPINWYIPEWNYTAGDKFQISVKYDWAG